MRLVQVFLLPSQQRSSFDAFPPGQDGGLPDPMPVSTDTSLGEAALVPIP